MSAPKLFQVPDNLLELVSKKFNYSSMDAFDNDVQNLKEWMKNQPHFPEIMEEKKIQNFLILNKGSVEKTKKKIHNYYSVRNRYPEIFGNINFITSKVQEDLDIGYFIPLPKLTKEMYRVFAAKIRDNTKIMKNFDVTDAITYLINLEEIRLYEDVTYADVFIFDCKDVPFYIITKVTPGIIYKALVAIYKNVYSNRVKAIYVLNAPPFTEIALAMLKSVVKPKIFSRVHILENIEALHERIEKEILPEDFGGDEKSLEELQDVVRNKFQEYKNCFLKLSELQINEELRPEHLNNDEAFGFYGNFKKLDID